MNVFAYNSPAKINLCLRIVGRRQDGMHLLESLLVPLELADQIKIKITPSSSKQSTVVCECVSHPFLSTNQNLAALAAKAYLRNTGQHANITIQIHKQIWIGSGLGGSSSNAATILLALNKYFSSLNPREMICLATELGADIPFFLNPCPSIARGIGERIMPVAAMPKLNFVLVNSGKTLSTKVIYEQFKKNFVINPKIKALPIPQNFDNFIDSVLSLLHNDLEAVATGFDPKILEIKDILLKQGSLGVGMTGSGPTVFGIFSSPVKAHQAVHNILNHNVFRVLGTHTLRLDSL